MDALTRDFLIDTAGLLCLVLFALWLNWDRMK